MRSRESWFRLVSVVAAVSVILSFSVVAAGSVSTASLAWAPVAPDGTEDGGAEILDVGAEFPSADAYPWGGSGDDLPYTSDSAWHFYNKMRDAGYTGSHSFIYGNNNAWETDWKRASLPGGQENSWIDNVDIMFFHDHGGSGGMYFPWGDHDGLANTDEWLVPNDCVGAWGDRDVEWIGIKSCLTLTDVVGWARCMNGVHVIAGMITISYGADYGGDWADQLLGWKWLGIWLRSPKTVTQAWFSACDSNQPSSVIARVIAEDQAHFNDKVWTRGGPAAPDASTWPKYYIDHSCYKAPPEKVDVALLESVPSQQVMGRTVTRESAKALAETLGLQGQPELSPDGTEYSLTDGSKLLTIQVATGGYVLQDLDKLWVPPAPGQPLNLPGPEEAAALAGAYFLAHAQALPGGANFDTSKPHVENDRMLEMTSALRTASPAAETGVDVLVAYPRTLSTTGATARGDAVPLNASVAGPGGTTKMYLGGGSAPIGLAGGSRDVQPGGGVTLKDIDASWEAFTADPGLAVLPPSIDYTSLVRHPEEDTFAYYEQPHDVAQKELIPSWVYGVDFMQGAQVAAHGLLYVPASPLYYPPSVTIDSPQEGDTVVAGKPIAMKSTVASGNGPLTYQWSSSTAGLLGTEEDITARLLNNSKPGEAPAPVVLTLKVTDANGLARSAAVTVNVAGGPVWLPLLYR